MKYPSLASRMKVLSPEGAYYVLTKATDLERKGKNIIHFEIGQPDFPTPKHIVRSAVTALHKGKTKYTSPLGIPELRGAIAAYISKTRRTRTSFRQVAVTPSGKTALFAAMAAVVNPGDHVMYPDPGFPTYSTLTKLFGAKAIGVPLISDQGFRMDIEFMKNHISGKTKLIIVNSPSNPTGGVLSKRDIEAIARLAKAAGAWVLSDEMYSDLVYSREPYASFYSIPGMKDRTLLVHGFSKTFSMTGWRLGYLVVPEKIIDRIDYLLTHTVGCTATFTQEAGIAAMTGGTRELLAMKREFRLRRDMVVVRLNRMRGVSCQVPEGAFYAFPDVSSFGVPSRIIADYLLTDAGVALLDGAGFGAGGEGFLRISYATSMRQLTRGLDRMEKSLGVFRRK